MLPLIDTGKLGDSIGIINAIVFVVNALSWKFMLIVFVGLIITFFVAGRVKRVFGCAVTLVMFVPTLLVLFLFVAGVVMRVFTTIEIVSTVVAADVTATGGVAQWLPDIKAEAEEQGVPASFVVGIMTVESAGNKDAVSSAGALGLMQVMPATAAESYICPAADLTNPQENIACGVTYIKWSADVLNIELSDGLTDSEARMLAMAYHGGATGALSPRPIDKRYAADVLSAMSMSQGTHEYPNVVAALYAGSLWRRSGTLGIHGGGAIDYYSATPQLYAPINGVITQNDMGTWIGPYDNLRTGNSRFAITNTETGEYVQILHGRFEGNVGDEVQAGFTKIGQQSSVGNSTGAHTHFIYKINGVAQSLP